MRKKFEQQLSLGVIPIGEVSINQKNRHQLAPVLVALQYIFTTPELSEQVFEILEDKILSGKKKTGRLGLSLWEILVLSSVRLSLGIDYDFLLDQANNHESLRGIMGVGKSDYTTSKEYKIQTIKDNVGLLDEETIRQINVMVVEAGHQLIKKNENIELRIKVDSYVVETDIHFPTDLNLLWDSGRKCYDCIDYYFSKNIVLSGWRKHRYNRNQFRVDYRRASEIHRLKGQYYDERLKVATNLYLESASTLSQKVHQSILELYVLLAAGKLSLMQILRIEVLKYYLEMLDKHIDLVQRRILEGEKIPHKEKIFSIFEPHTEWLTKGKLHKQPELGHNVSVATDQYQFIVDYEVMVHQSDPEMGMLLGLRLIECFKNSYKIYSISFDRGFYSSLLKKVLSKEIEKVIMPKRGKKSEKQKEEESDEQFIKLRKEHSAVESNINQLEHNGLDRCPDQGIDGFKKYVGLGVLAYNLHHLGKLLIKQRQQAEIKKMKRQQRLKQTG